MTKRVWVVLADGARARILSFDGETPLAEQSAWTAASLNAKTHDLVAGRAGRVTKGGDPKRHALEPASDPKRLAKARFVRDLADRIAASAREFDHLVIAAPAAVLGELRRCLKPAVAGRVVLELERDLTKAPIRDLRARLVAALPKALAPPSARQGVASR